MEVSREATGLTDPGCTTYYSWCTCLLDIYYIYSNIHILECILHIRWKNTFPFDSHGWLLSVHHVSLHIQNSKSPTCKLEGSPRPHVVWYHLNSPQTENCSYKQMPSNASKQRQQKINKSNHHSKTLYELTLNIELRYLCRRCLVQTCALRMFLWKLDTSKPLKSWAGYGEFIKSWPQSHIALFDRKAGSTVLEKPVDVAWYQLVRSNSQNWCQSQIAQRCWQRRTFSSAINPSAYGRRAVLPAKKPAFMSTFCSRPVHLKISWNSKSS